MSQAMLMRIITLEKKVDELEKRLVVTEPLVGYGLEPQTISWSQIHDPNNFAPLAGDVPFVHPVNDLPYRLEQHGVGWWRVFGPQGEITDKGLRRHEAQAMADQLNEQAVSQTA